MTCTGVVKGNIVVLDNGAQLSDGSRVLVSALEGTELSQNEAIELLLRNPVHRHVGIDKIIDEMKQEREERDASRLSS